MSAKTDKYELSEDKTNYYYTFEKSVFIDFQYIVSVINQKLLQSKE